MVSRPTPRDALIKMVALAMGLCLSSSMSSALDEKYFAEGLASAAVFMRANLTFNIIRVINSSYES